MVGRDEEREDRTRRHSSNPHRRNVARALEREIIGTADPRAEVTVVLPRRDYAQLRQRILHDRTSRSISRALGRYEHVDITVVPYFFLPEKGRARGRPRPADGGAVTIDLAGKR